MAAVDDLPAACCCLGDSTRDECHQSFKLIRFKRWLAWTTDTEHSDFVADDREDSSVPSSSSSLEKELTKLVSHRLGFWCESIAVWVIDQFVDGFVKSEPSANSPIGRKRFEPVENVLSVAFGSWQNSQSEASWRFSNAVSSAKFPGEIVERASGFAALHVSERSLDRQQIRFIRLKRTQLRGWHRF